MKRIFHIILISAMTLVSASAFAQPQGQGNVPDMNQFAKQWQERIESEKIAFLTSEMSLTPAEAQAFWPVYNQAQKEQQQAVEESFKLFGQLDAAIREGKSEKEIDSLLEAYTRANAKRDVSAKYLKEYQKILSSEKVARLFLGEEKFRQSQIHRLRQPQMGGGFPQVPGSGQNQGRSGHPQQQQERNR